MKKIDIVTCSLAAKTPVGGVSVLPPGGFKQGIIHVHTQHSTLLYNFVKAYSIV